MGIVKEYHESMQRSISASITLACVLAVMLFLVASSQGQVNGPPASVTSPGFGGNPINGPAPSVTSLGPHGYSPTPPRFSGSVDGHRGGGDHGKNRDRDGDRDHGRRDGSGGAVWYAYPVPYAVEDNGPVDNSEAAANEPDDQGGPTVFDRHGSGGHAYMPPEKEAVPAHSTQVAEKEPPSEPDPPQEPTLLVFKNGSKVEVDNYAIQGATLFDLTPGHRRKIALADLDLDATRKQNDERGVTFQLPSTYKAAK
jgi:hypothetical protein